MLVVNGIPQTNAQLSVIDTNVDDIESAVITEIADIQTETDKIPATITKIDNIKTETDKIPAEVIKTAALNTNLGTMEDDEEDNTLCGRSYISNRHHHGRNRSYPFTGSGVTLTGGSGASVFGAYTEIIPVLSNEVNTMTITSGASSAGNVVINLNGTSLTKAVSIGSAAEVAAQLRGYTYVGRECGEWAVSGTGAEVIFTRSGISSTATFTDVGATGVTASIVKTSTGTGVNTTFDIHVIQAAVANVKDTYIIELSKGLSGYEQRLGNIRITSNAINAALGNIPTMTEVLPAGTRISARIATLTGGEDTLVVSLNYHVY